MATHPRYEEHRFFTRSFTLREFDLILFGLTEIGTYEALDLAEKLRRTALPSMGREPEEDTDDGPRQPNPFSRARPDDG